MLSLWQRLFGAAPPAPVAVMQRTRPRAVPATVAREVVLKSVDDASAALTPTELNEAFHRLIFAMPAAAEGTPMSNGSAMLKRLELLSTRFDVRSLPRLPTVLPQLLRSLKSDTAAGGELARLVARDPLMVGEVMRVTGSVVYRSAQPISSLQQAVVLLGQDGLRRVITQHAMKPILQSNTAGLGHAGEYLWDHAQKCAHACAWLAKHHRVDGFEAYLAGIVCHTGTGAVVRLLAQLLADAPATSMDASFIHACAGLAARLSHQAAEHWELPPNVRAALEEREQPGSTDLSPLGQALAAADAMSMARLLVVHRFPGPKGGLKSDPDLSTWWPDQYTPAMLLRCQSDLRKHFRARDEAILAHPH